MSVRKNNNRYLADFMFNGYRYRRQFVTIEEAQAWEAELKKRLRLGLPYQEMLEGDADGITLRDLLEKTMVRYWENGANEQTQTTNIRQITNHFGEDFLARNLSTAQLDTFVSAMEKRNLAASTINSRLATLSKAFTFGIDRGYVDTRPKIERKKVSNQRLRFFTDEEVFQIVAFLEGDGRDGFARFFEWSLETGMRPIESRNFVQSAVREDPDLGYLVDLRKTKNAYPRTIPLTQKAYQAYMSHTDELMPFARYTETQISKHWKFIRECFNITDPEFVFYLTRHTCASRLVQRSVPLQVVKEWMGHRTFEMTLRYAKLSPKNLLDAKAALEQAS